MSHYFQTPTGQERRREITARFWDADWTFETADGVFAADRLDIGTSVLLRACAPPAGPGRVLDLGCGWGPIAVALAVASPSLLVDAVDVNERALDLCRRNAERHGVADRVRAFTPAATSPDEDRAVYDEIWSNPPIRVGKAALRELLATWLPRLKPGGAARLVVGKNLGADSLQRWLEAEGWSCRRVASAKGFRVFEVVRQGPSA
ncbi:MAG: methyltransferase [Propionibacteriaceae bacterium]|jgi:16S rRNA G1207 methylase RsmC|nr:methyltransferase [Propionibacteriaceae bacterium]